jgi:pyruvate-formate lyase-activating enzyme
MDIKNGPEYYAKTIGVKNIDLKPIEESIQYLLENHVDYEFRTTIVKELHDEESIISLGRWIKGAKRLYLQNFEESEGVIQKGLHAHDKKTLERFKELLSDNVEKIDIRGI